MSSLRGTACARLAGERRLVDHSLRNLSAGKKNPNLPQRKFSSIPL